MARVTWFIGAVLLGASWLPAHAQQVYYYSPEPPSGGRPARAAGRNYSVFGVEGHGFYYRYEDQDDGMGYGVAAILRPFSILAIEGGVDWYQRVREQEVGDGAYVVLLDVDEEVLDAFLGLRLYLSGTWVLQPYLTAGVDYVENDETFDALVSVPGQGQVEVPVDGEVEDAFGYHLGAGIDWVLNPNVALSAEARWVSADLEADISAGDLQVELDETKTDVFTVRVGLRIGI